MTFNLNPEGKEKGTCKVVREHEAEKMLCVQARQFEEQKLGVDGILSRGQRVMRAVS